jgi:uncharacterized protein (TIGR03067 family)
MTYVRILVALLVMSAGLAAQGGKPAAASKAAVPLQGTWIVTSINGKPAGEGSPELTLTFAGDKYHQAVGGKVNERGTIKIDTSKKPMTIDLAITEGSDAGKAQLGIVEVKGDTLRASFDQPGAGKRPTSFEITEGALAIVGKRKKT